MLKRLMMAVMGFCRRCNACISHCDKCNTTFCYKCDGSTTCPKCGSWCA